MTSKSEDDLSADEELARKFELAQKEYFDEVDSYFASQNRARGDVAFSAWEQRFLEFIEREAPSLVPIYTQNVRAIEPTYFFGSGIHQTWKRGKGDSVEAFLIQAMQDARAGRLYKAARTSPSPEPAAKTSPSVAEPRKARKVFIGHGRSPVWKDLKDFIAERLNLPWDEFNREPAAGRTTTARLSEMLDQASFAFVVLTAEDEHPDGSFHARENVIHEAGLFQGRLGFERAILLVEDGCAEFSNLSGLTQIRFPKGNISAVSEEIRRVLEREGVLGNA